MSILLVWISLEFVKLSRLSGCLDFLYNTTLKHISFGPLLDMGLFVGYKVFSLISFGDKPLLGGGYARVFLLHMYMQPAWHTRLVRC